MQLPSTHDGPKEDAIAPAPAPAESDKPPSDRRATERTLDRATTASTTTCLSPSTAAAAAALPPPIRSARLLRTRRHFWRGKAGRYAPAARTRLRNSLLGSVAFLELGNAVDFAANVWNTVPVPAFAVALMAAGGTFAAVMCACALWDARRAWHNIAVLWTERLALRATRSQRREDVEAGLKKSGGGGMDEVDVFLDVNFRELGGEIVNREGMNVLLGFGLLIICIGTFMAIGGNDPSVWYVSNLLSGYVGNTPLAAYSLLNTMWAAHIFRKARAHERAARRVFGRSPGGDDGATGAETDEEKKSAGGGGRSDSCASFVPGETQPYGGGSGAVIDDEILGALGRRVRNVQVFVVVNGVASLVGGAASLMTATLWYGYAMLVPVIAASIFCNFWWRHRVGYDRPPVVVGVVGSPGAGAGAGLMVPALVSEIASCRAAGAALRDRDRPAFGGLVSEPRSLEAVLRFLVEADLFEEFCAALFRGRDELGPRLFPTGEASEFTLEPGDFLKSGEEWHGRLVEAADKCVAKVGSRHFASREWHLLELLGAYLALEQEKR